MNYTTAFAERVATSIPLGWLHAVANSAITDEQWKNQVPNQFSESGYKFRTDELNSQWRSIVFHRELVEKEWQKWGKIKYAA
mgnify:CR=1 FL=1